MPKFNHNGIETNYEVWGDLGTKKRPLLLINGYTRGMSDFRAMAQFLNKNGICCLSLDNRCSGMTTDDGRPFDLKDLAADAVNLVRHLNIDSIDVLGISMGGLIAQLLPVIDADLVQRMILVSTSPTPQLEQLQSDHWRPDIEAIEERLERNFSESFIAKNRLLVRAMAKNILKEIESNRFAERADRQRSAIRTTPSRYFDSEINIPAFIVHGDVDRVIGIEAVKGLERKFRAAKTKIFNNAGHLLIAERPSELYGAVLNYLNSGHVSDQSNF